MKKKKSTSQRNFFRTMTFLGILIVGGVGYEFISAAPKLSPIDFHKESIAPGKCVQCHTQNVKNVPIMPHRPLEFCRFCHPPQEAIEP